MNDRFDRDPEALAWARVKVQQHVDKLAGFEQQAIANGDGDQAGRWARIASYMRMRLIGGAGCSIAAFDERLPAHRELLDRATPVGGERSDG